MGPEPNTPVLQHSSLQMFHMSPLQMLAESRQDSTTSLVQRFRDHFCGVIARRAGDVAAGMAG
jgi:hypothetical protein